MIKCIVIEDEDNSRDLLKNLINRYCPDLEIIATASTVTEAINVINFHKPDILFLDIEIGDGTGFDVLNGLEHKKYGIIFTTGYNQFAIRAIKYSAIDYLLKPIDFEELIDAVKKYREMNHPIIDERHLALKTNFTSNKDLQTLIIPSSKGFTVHSITDICRLSSEGNYTTFKIKNDLLLASKPIGYFEELLPESQFYRIHNRTIINVFKIKEYVRGKGGTIVMQDGEQLDVSERRKEGLIKLLQKS